MSPPLRRETSHSYPPTPARPSGIALLDDPRRGRGPLFHRHTLTAGRFCVCGTTASATRLVVSAPNSALVIPSSGKRTLSGFESFTSGTCTAFGARGRFPALRGEREVRHQLLEPTAIAITRMARTRPKPANAAAPLSAAAAQGVGEAPRHLRVLALLPQRHDDQLAARRCPPCSHVDEVGVARRSRTSVRATLARARPGPRRSPCRHAA